MNAMTRTIVFVAVAAVSAGAAWMTVVSTRPAEVSGFEQVGESFYPDFTDPTQADALMVVVFEDDTATARQFSVESRDGNWVIPSHHDYPAEATNRLAETAASVNQITRGALKSRRKTEHERFGVIDPLDQENTALKGRGRRLTLWEGGRNGTVLSDLIIGKAVENQENTYYVRRADEDAVYATRIEIDLSTDFTDWIEPDLLKLDRDNVNRLVLNRYTLDLDRGQILNPEISILTRDSLSDDWKLDGIEENEEVKDADVDELARHIDDLKIVGVRPKPEGLRADLSLEPDIEGDIERLSVLQSSLQRRGFFLAQVTGAGRQLVSKEGEVLAGTNEGALYHLHFGNLFTGNTKAIEIGLDGAVSKKDESATAEGDAAENETDEDSSDDSPSRYLFVRVEFDERLLGPKPVEPVAPEVPEGFEEWEKQQQEAARKAAADSAGGQPEGKPETPESSADPAAAKQPDESGCETQDVNPPGSPAAQTPAADPPETPAEGTSEPPAAAVEKPATEQNSTEPPAAQNPATSNPSVTPAEKAAEAAPQSATDKPDQEPAAESTPAAENAQPSTDQPAEAPQFVEYRIARSKYEADLETYQNDLAEYERKVEEGQKKVAELNRRFSAWYYVISAESFEKLKVSRADIVQPRMESPESAPGTPENNGTAPAANETDKKDGEITEPPAASQPDEKPETPNDPPAAPATEPGGEKTPREVKTPESAAPSPEDPPTEKQPEQPGQTPSESTDPAAEKPADGGSESPVNPDSAA